MAWEGMVTEALAICRGIHERYHPSKHNPWNEIECGDHYARALASWGVLVGLSGFEYQGPAGRIGFAPRITPEDFRCAFTAAEGWGTLSQRREGNQQTNEIAVQWGRLPLAEAAFELPPGARLAEASVRLGDLAIEVVTSQIGQRVTVACPPGTVVQAGAIMERRRPDAGPGATQRGRALQVRMNW